MPLNCPACGAAVSARAFRYESVYAFECPDCGAGLSLTGRGVTAGLCVMAVLATAFVVVAGPIVLGSWLATWVVAFLASFLPVLVTQGAFFPPGVRLTGNPPPPPGVRYAPHGEEEPPDLFLGPRPITLGLSEPRRETGAGPSDQARAGRDAPDESKSGPSDRRPSG